MSIKPTNRIPPEIATILGRMRRGVQRYFIIDGLKYVFAILIALIVLDFLIDRTFRMDFAQRLIMLVLSVGYLSFVVIKRLFKPLMSRLSDDALMLELEKANGGMNEALISALELSRMRVSDGANVSIEMIDQTVKTGVLHVEDVDISLSLIHI